MPDIRIDRSITKVDITRLKECCPQEIDSCQIDSAYSHRNRRNNQQEYLAVWSREDLSHKSHLKLIEGDWCAHVEPRDRSFKVELTPLKAIEPPPFCFHATERDNLGEIERQGLARGSVCGVSSSGDSFSGARYFIHVSTSLTDATKWATFPHLLLLTEPVYLRIDMGSAVGPTFVDPSSSTGIVINADRVPWTSLRELSQTEIDETLWKEMEQMLCFHREHSDESATHVLNRLFREHVSGAPAILRDDCTISLVPFFWRDLQGMYRRTGENNEPRRTDVPLIIVRLDGNDYVVDGHRRANKRIREGLRFENDPEQEERPLSALVIEPSGNSSHV